MKRKLRLSANRKLTGVCGGLGEYFKVDPTVVRLLVLIVFLFFPGHVAIIYLLLWAVLPKQEIWRD